MGWATVVQVLGDWWTLLVGKLQDWRPAAADVDDWQEEDAAAESSAGGARRVIHGAAQSGREVLGLPGARS